MSSSKSLPTSYAEAVATLDGNYSRKLMHNTYAVRHSGHSDESQDSVGIVLHNTAVIRFYADGRIVLNTGGWYTVTTKDRLNRCLPYPWHVASDARKGGWGLYENSERVAHYSDGMELRPDSNGKLRPWRGGSDFPITLLGDREHAAKQQEAIKRLTGRNV